MGSGPACVLADNFCPRALILMSPYMSIKQVAKNMFGGWISWMVSDHFNNLECMKTIACPVFFIHGDKDTLIPSDHSR